MFTIHPMTSEDRKPVMTIFNHYVEHSFAAYPEKPLPEEFFDMMLGASNGLPALRIAKGEETVGFGMLRPWNPFPAFATTAEISYFITPEHTGKGGGRLLLQELLTCGKAQGISNVLAVISSLNDASLAFHSVNGFSRCGVFPGIGRKQGRDFDVIWMIRKLI